MHQLTSTGPHVTRVYIQFRSSLKQCWSSDKHSIIECSWKCSHLHDLFFFFPDAKYHEDGGLLYHERLLAR